MKKFINKCLSIFINTKLVKVLVRLYINLFYFTERKFFEIVDRSPIFVKHFVDKCGELLSKRPRNFKELYTLVLISYYWVVDKKNSSIDKFDATVLAAIIFLQNIVCGVGFFFKFLCKLPKIIYTNVPKNREEFRVVCVESYRSLGQFLVYDVYFYYLGVLHFFKGDSIFLYSVKYKCYCCMIVKLKNLYYLNKFDFFFVLFLEIIYFFKSILYKFIWFFKIIYVKFLYVWYVHIVSQARFLRFRLKPFLVDMYKRRIDSLYQRNINGIYQLEDKLQSSFFRRFSFSLKSIFVSYLGINIFKERWYHKFSEYIYAKYDFLRGLEYPIKSCYTFRSTYYNKSLSEGKDLFPAKNKFFDGDGRVSPFLDEVASSPAFGFFDIFPNFSPRNFFLNIDHIRGKNFSIFGRVLDPSETGLIHADESAAGLKKAAEYKKHNEAVIKAGVDLQKAAENVAGGSEQFNIKLRKFSDLLMNKEKFSELNRKVIENTLKGEGSSRFKHMESATNDGMVAVLKKANLLVGYDSAIGPMYEAQLAAQVVHWIRALFTYGTLGVLVLVFFVILSKHRSIIFSTFTDVRMRVISMIKFAFFFYIFLSGVSMFFLRAAAYFFVLFWVNVYIAVTQDPTILDTLRDWIPEFLVFPETCGNFVNGALEYTKAPKSSVWLDTDLASHSKKMSKFVVYYDDIIEFLEYRKYTNHEVKRDVSDDLVINTSRHQFKQTSVQSLMKGRSYLEGESLVSRYYSLGRSITNDLVFESINPLLLSNADYSNDSRIGTYGRWFFSKGGLTNKMYNSIASFDGQQRKLVSTSDLENEGLLYLKYRERAGSLRYLSMLDSSFKEYVVNYLENTVSDGVYPGEVASYRNLLPYFKIPAIYRRYLDFTGSPLTSNLGGGYHLTVSSYYPYHLKKIAYARRDELMVLSVEDEVSKPSKYKLGVSTFGKPIGIREGGPLKAQLSDVSFLNSWGVPELDFARYVVEDNFGNVDIFVISENDLREYYTIELDKTFLAQWEAKQAFLKNIRRNNNSFGPFAEGLFNGYKSWLKDNKLPFIMRTWYPKSAKVGEPEGGLSVGIFEQKNALASADLTSFSRHLNPIESVAVQHLHRELTFIHGVIDLQGIFSKYNPENYTKHNFLEAGFSNMMFNDVERLNHSSRYFGNIVNLMVSNFKDNYLYSYDQDKFVNAYKHLSRAGYQRNVYDDFFRHYLVTLDQHYNSVDFFLGSTVDKLDINLPKDKCISRKFYSLLDKKFNNDSALRRDYLDIHLDGDTAGLLPSARDIAQKLAQLHVTPGYDYTHVVDIASAVKTFIILNFKLFFGAAKGFGTGASFFIKAMVPDMSALLEQKRQEIITISVGNRYRSSYTPSSLGHGVHYRESVDVDESFVTYTEDDRQIIWELNANCSDYFFQSGPPINSFFHDFDSLIHKDSKELLLYQVSLIDYMSSAFKNGSTLRYEEFRYADEYFERLRRLINYKIAEEESKGVFIARYFLDDKIFEKSFLHWPDFEENKGTDENDPSVLKPYKVVSLAKSIYLRPFAGTCPPDLNQKLMLSVLDHLRIDSSELTINEKRVYRAAISQYLDDYVSGPYLLDNDYQAVVELLIKKIVTVSDQLGLAPISVIKARDVFKVEEAKYLSLYPESTIISPETAPVISEKQVDVVVEEDKEEEDLDLGQHSTDTKITPSDFLINERQKRAEMEEEVRRELALAEEALRESELAEEALRKVLAEEVLRDAGVSEEVIGDTNAFEEALRDAGLSEEEALRKALDEKAMRDAGFNEEEIQELALDEAAMRASAVSEESLKRMDHLNKFLKATEDSIREVSVESSFGKESLISKGYIDTIDDKFKVFISKDDEHLRMRFRNVPAATFFSKYYLPTFCKYSASCGKPDSENNVLDVAQSVGYHIALVRQKEILTEKIASGDTTLLAAIKRSTSEIYDKAYDFFKEETTIKQPVLPGFGDSNSLTYYKRCDLLGRHLENAVSIEGVPFETLMRAYKLYKENELGLRLCAVLGDVSYKSLLLASEEVDNVSSDDSSSSSSEETEPYWVASSLSLSSDPSWVNFVMMCKELNISPMAFHEFPNVVCDKDGKELKGVNDFIMSLVDDGLLDRETVKKEKNDKLLLELFDSFEGMGHDFDGIGALHGFAQNLLVARGLLQQNIAVLSEELTSRNIPHTVTLQKAFEDDPVSDNNLVVNKSSKVANLVDKKADVVSLDYVDIDRSLICRGHSLSSMTYLDLHNRFVYIEELIGKVDARISATKNIANDNKDWELRLKLFNELRETLHALVERGSTSEVESSKYLINVPKFNISCLPMLEELSSIIKQESSADMYPTVFKEEDLSVFSTKELYLRCLKLKVHIKSMGKLDHSISSPGKVLHVVSDLRKELVKVHDVLKDRVSGSSSEFNQLKASMFLDKVLKNQKSDLDLFNLVNETEVGYHKHNPERHDYLLYMSRALFMCSIEHLDKFTYEQLADYQKNLDNRFATLSEIRGDLLDPVGRMLFALHKIEGAKIREHVFDIMEREIYNSSRDVGKPAVAFALNHGIQNMVGTSVLRWIRLMKDCAARTPISGGIRSEEHAEFFWMECRSTRTSAKHLFLQCLYLDEMLKHLSDLEGLVIYEAKHRLLKEYNEVFENLSVKLAEGDTSAHHLLECFAFKDLKMSIVAFNLTGDLQFMSVFDRLRLLREPEGPIVNQTVDSLLKMEPKAIDYESMSAKEVLIHSKKLMLDIDCCNKVYSDSCTDKTKVVIPLLEKEIERAMSSYYKKCKNKDKSAFYSEGVEDPLFCENMRKLQFLKDLEAIRASSSGWDGREK